MAAVSDVAGPSSNWDTREPQRETSAGHAEGRREAARGTGGPLAGLQSVTRAPAARGQASTPRPAPRDPTAVEIRSAQRLLRENQAALAQGRGDEYLYPRLSRIGEQHGLPPLRNFVSEAGESTNRAKSIKRADRGLGIAASVAATAGSLTGLFPVSSLADGYMMQRANQRRESDVFGNADLTRVRPRHNNEGIPSEPAPAYGDHERNDQLSPPAYLESEERLNPLYRPIGGSE